MIVYFERCGPDFAITLGSYDPIAVETIKAVVPSFARRWSPPRREWIIEIVYGKPLADALRQLGHTVTGLDGRRRDDRQCDCGDDSDWARILFRRVGPNRVGPVFRALSKCFHPDMGGDTELQRELNAAHAELSTRQRRKSA